jgi:hypothetical protein
MGFLSNLFSSGFDDPKPMDNNKLVGAIAGQADWLDKMVKSPYETQRTKSIIELTAKRKGYLSDLCLEVISRGEADDGQGARYPGATKSINVFEETAEYCNNIILQGLSKEAAAIRAVKEKLFAENGAQYIADWES